METPFLIGKTESGFFAFDSHSRSSDGMLSVSGKSTRVLLHNEAEVYSHVQDLALSMGYSHRVERNFTGVFCTMSSIENVSKLFWEEEDASEIFEISSVLEEMSVGTDDQNDSVMFIGQEQFKFSFFSFEFKLEKRSLSKTECSLHLHQFS